ncbi:MAG: TCR/Tet family MFS transporter [Pseudomonadota bacterium]
MTKPDCENGQKNALRFIAAVIAIDMAGVGIIIPVMPDLIEALGGAQIGDAAALGGWLVFAYAGLQFICAPIAGNLGDRFGRRPVLLAALAGLAVDYLIMGFAGSLAVLFLGRALAGVAGSTWSVANALIADISSAKDRARNFGIVSAASAAGLVLGPAIGGILGDFGPRVPFFGAAFLTLAAFVFGWSVMPETLKPANRRPFEWARANPFGSLFEASKRQYVGGILIASFILQLANQSLVHIWAYYTKAKFAWTPLEIGLSVTFYGIAVAVVQGGLTGPIVNRFGEQRVVIGGLIAAAFGYLALAVAPSAAPIFFAMILGAFGGLATPAMQAIITKATPADAQGALQGAVTSVVAIATVVGPVMMTQIFRAFTEPGAAYFPGAPFAASAGLTAISLLVFFATKNAKAKAAIVVPMQHEKEADRAA